MDKRIIYTRPDGGISVVIPCKGIDEKHLSDEQVIQRAMNRLPDNAGNPQIVSIEDVPTNRTFRSAWEAPSGKIQVNMDKAREIHLERIRTARDKVLAALDIETIKALGKDDKEALAAVEAQKQVLRDIPQTVDLSKATTPEELMTLWPEELK